MSRRESTRRRIFGALLALLLVGLPVVGSRAQAADLPTVKQVLDRFVSAVGGRAALERVDTRHYRGTIVQDLTWTDPQHQETPFVAEAHADGRVRYAQSADWGDLPEIDSGEPREKLRWLMHPRFALVVLRHFPNLHVKGHERRDGRTVIVLAPGTLPYEHYALCFDEKTGLLTHIGYHDDLEDWREVDGVLFPSRFVFGRKGGHTTYHFEEIAPGPAPAGD